VRITDGAIVAAATLSNRYITDRFLPDKAIDLMDEAASRLRMQVDSKPEELDELDRRIIQLKIEREALKRETDRASQDRLEKLEVDLSDLEEKSAALTARWNEEKKSLHSAQKLKEEIDKARQELDIAQRRGNLARAGELAYGVIPDLERKLKAMEGKENERLVNEAVTEEHIAGVSRVGPAFPSTRCSKANARSCYIWRTVSKNGSSARTKQCALFRMLYDAPALAFRILTGRSVRSCFWVRRVSERPSSPKPWLRSCSTMTAQWCASTCLNSWRNIRSRA
jgi:hypothetical protein